MRMLAVRFAAFRPRHKAAPSLHPPPAAVGLATSSLTAFGTRDRRFNPPTKTREKAPTSVGAFSLGRDDRIRTCGLFVPNEARYQTALYPEIKYLVFSIFPCLWDNMWSKLVWPHVFCFLSRRKVAVLKGLCEFGLILMNWIVQCPERSALPNCAISRLKTNIILSRIQIFVNNSPFYF